MSTPTHGRTLRKLSAILEQMYQYDEWKNRPESRLADQRPATIPTGAAYTELYDRATKIMQQSCVHDFIVHRRSHYFIHDGQLSRYPVFDISGLLLKADTGIHRIDVAIQLANLLQRRADEQAQAAFPWLDDYKIEHILQTWFATAFIVYHGMTFNTYEHKAGIMIVPVTDLTPHDTEPASDEDGK